jgi:hypothetical protein
MKKILGLAAPLSVIATAVLAVDTPVGRLEPYGEISLRTFSVPGSGGSDEFFFGDFGVRLSPLMTSGPLKYSVYVGFDGWHDLSSGYEYGYETAAVVLEKGNHAVSFGMPRSVIHDTFDDRSLISSELDGTGSVNWGDAVRSIRMYATSPIYGVRYDGDFGKTALSVGVFSGKYSGEDMHSMQVTLKHEVGGVKLRAAFEHLQSDFINNVTSSPEAVNVYSLGATTIFNKLLVGTDFSFVDYHNEYQNFNFTRVFGSYNVTEQLRVGASYSEFGRRRGSQKSTSLGVEYAQSNGAYARLSGIFGLGNGSGNDAYELAVGLRF